eukprot:Tbor_TRINITY_DN2253_c0_g1::TRINITY_DN2253_c0_g1_i1::g.2797::m.2797
MTSDVISVRQVKTNLHSHLDTSASKSSVRSLLREYALIAQFCPVSDIGEMRDGEVQISNTNSLETFRNLRALVLSGERDVIGHQLIYSHLVHIAKDRYSIAHLPSESPFISHTSHSTSRLHSCQLQELQHLAAKAMYQWRNDTEDEINIVTRRVANEALRRYHLSLKDRGKVGVDVHVRWLLSQADVPNTQHLMPPSPLLAELTILDAEAVRKKLLSRRMAEVVQYGMLRVSKDRGMSECKDVAHLKSINPQHNSKSIITHQLPACQHTLTTPLVQGTHSVSYEEEGGSNEVSCINSPEDTKVSNLGRTIVITKTDNGDPDQKKSGVMGGGLLATGRKSYPLRCHPSHIPTLSQCYNQARHELLNSSGVCTNKTCSILLPEATISCSFEACSFLPLSSGPISAGQKRIREEEPINCLASAPENSVMKSNKRVRCPGLLQVLYLSCAAPFISRDTLYKDVTGDFLRIPRIWSGNHLGPVGVTRALFKSLDELHRLDTAYCTHQPILSECGVDEPKVPPTDITRITPCEPVSGAPLVVVGPQRDYDFVAAAARWLPRFA